MPSTVARLSSAARLRTAVRRYTMRSIDALGHAPLMDPGTGRGPRTLAVGPDPVRVLLFGAGLAVGYGVASREQALDGPLAAAVAAASGRGVVLENRAVQHLRIGDGVASLGSTAAHTFDVAVWFPSFADATTLLRLRAWRTRLEQLVRDLRAASPVPLVLTAMPVPTGRHPAALLARPWLQAVNRVIAQVAAAHEQVEFAATEPFGVGDAGQLDADPRYFARVADLLAPAVLRLLRLDEPALQPR